MELDVQGTFADGKVGFYEFWQDTVTFKDLSVATGSFTETQQVSFSQDVFAAHEGGSATVTVGIDVDLDSDLTVPVLATDSTGLSSSIALRTRGLGTPGLPTYFQLAIPGESITDTSFVVRFKGWGGSNPQ